MKLLIIFLKKFIQIMILVQLDASSFVHLPLYEQQILTTQFVRCVFMGYGLDKRISMIGLVLLLVYFRVSSVNSILFQLIAARRIP